MLDKAFSVDTGSPGRSLPHVWENIIGSGHATLALRADYLAQLGRCRRELGIRHVRFHGILSDDVGTLIVSQGKKIFSFFNADRILDSLVDIGMKPFVELSFMPSCIAKGDQTVMHYHDIVTPPADMTDWIELIDKLVRHWVARYGLEEVRSWPFEVWNEPNLPAFWSGDRATYFRLFEATFRTIKAIDSQIAVGGPATAACAWIEEFVAHCRKRKLRFDFLSTHLYPTDALGSSKQDTRSELAASPRDMMRTKAEFVRERVPKERPVYFTEWSSSSNSQDPLHDESFAAAFLARTILENNGLVDAYSWWTFSDIFSESYFPSVPFHGGFGLLNLHGIPKPSYRAFELLHGLGDTMLPVRGTHPTIDVYPTRDAAGDLVVLLTNHARPTHPIRNERVEVHLTHCENPAAGALVRRIDTHHANPRAAWAAMGEPGYLSAQQVADLEAASTCVPEPLEVTWDRHTLGFVLDLPAHAVASVRIALSRPGSMTSTAVDSSDAEFLARLQEDSFSFFSGERDSLRDGLFPDKTDPDSPASIASIGFALASYAVAAEARFLERGEAAIAVRTSLRFLAASTQSLGPEASGYRGFFYHFLDRRTGRRADDSELSSIDTALLVAGALVASRYFDRADPVETEVRERADALYRRVEWDWMCGDEATLTMGWKQDGGFLDTRWRGYNEGLLLYILALGSPTHAIAPEGFLDSVSHYRWRRLYGLELAYAGPLFIHQMPQSFIDFRGIRDAFMREHDSDYFENSRRATYVQQRYAMANAHRFAGYGADFWGITASDGPGPARRRYRGRSVAFHGYKARGVPYGPDDGCVAPWAVVASLPFAPEIVLPTLRNFVAMGSEHRTIRIRGNT